MPISTASTAANPISSSVRGSRAPISSATGLPSCNDRPRSPARKWPKSSKYCMSTERSGCTAGSPGARRTVRNTMDAVAQTSRTATPIRLAIQGISWRFLQNWWMRTAAYALRRFRVAPNRAPLHGNRANASGIVVASAFPVIASEAKQSPSRDALRWRLPRRFAPRNDRTTRTIALSAARRRRFT